MEIWRELGMTTSQCELGNIQGERDSSSPSSRKTKSIEDFKLHSIHSKIPRMCENVRESFREDIKENGIREPVKVNPKDEDEILDGRERYKEAFDLGIEELPYEVANLNGISPVEYIIKSALLRRHLSKSQKAMLAVELKPELEEEAEKRKLRTLKKGEKDPDVEKKINILYYHTDQEDLVIDPMAGGASTVDACLIMGRDCRAYDIKPSRDDILKNDIREGYRKKANGADLILLDPPYGDKMVDEYGGHGFTGGSDEVGENLDQLAEESYEALSTGGKVAFIFGNTKSKKGNGDIWAPDLYQLFRDKGFETEFVYHAPYKGHSNPSGEIQQKSRDIYIFKKE
ncbi:hypothetical protein AKJ62_01565 [candidate division MSBL1 archaeon SCGC-AAA259D14]|uniref:DNA methylase N-4/N-6 domain-containing protein n=1 Tax=candidate division MSBL1 archaeon SCGC-AAA259D14 TaxID=1698261 RepID=A0A133U7H5_9EURY|nr:hypothetical protein AKJ62_01565 [candidate division MSBL1 archaeon SCGC-AAA259D14]